MLWLETIFLLYSRRWDIANKQDSNKAKVPSPPPPLRNLSPFQIWLYYIP